MGNYKAASFSKISLFLQKKEFQNYDIYKRISEIVPFIYGSNFSMIFDTHLPHVGRILDLSMAIFDQFLTPLHCRHLLWTLGNFWFFFFENTIL